MMRENSGTKVYLNLVARMKKLPGTDFDDVIEKMRKKISENFEKLETAVGSGWALVKIQNLKLHVAEFKTLKGSSYVELPEWVKNKKTVINILNMTDNECFKWCVTRAMHPIGKNQNLITKKLREQSKIFDWTGVNFPTSFEDISRFEKNNGVSVKVLGCDEETKEVVHLRNRNSRYKLAVTLLLFEEHYCLVKNISRLVSRQICDGANYFCDYCSFSNCVKSVVLKHQESCTGDSFEPEREFPKPGTFLRFKNCERSAEQPFVIYADFESRLRPMFEKKGGSTTQYQDYVPIGYAYYLVCRFDATENIFRSYTAKSDEEDIGLHFVVKSRPNSKNRSTSSLCASFPWTSNFPKSFMTSSRTTLPLRIRSSWEESKSWHRTSFQRQNTFPTSETSGSTRNSVAGFPRYTKRWLSMRLPG